MTMRYDVLTACFALTATMALVVFGLMVKATDRLEELAAW